MHVLNILWVVFGIGLMLVLNLKFKINSMVALLVAALSVGMLAGMDLMSLLHTMKAGFGNTLGELAIIVVFGAVIGKLMVDSGAAHQIAHTLLARLGLRYVQLSVIIIGLIFGLAMFYEVAFIMLAPLVIVIAAEAKIPFLKLAIPAVAAATTAHSLFPPQPGPVALVNAYGADMGMVYIYGVLVTIDLKAWGSECHQQLTGRDNQQIKRSICLLAERGKLAELRLLVIPDQVDYLHHIDELATFIKRLGDVPVRLNAFHAHGVYGEAQSWASATPEDVEPLADALKVRGVSRLIFPALYL